MSTFSQPLGGEESSQLLPEQNEQIRRLKRQRPLNALTDRFFDVVSAEAEAFEKKRDELQTQLDEKEAELESARRERRTESADLDATRLERDALRTQLDQLRDSARQTNAQFEAQIERLQRQVAESGTASTTAQQTLNATAAANAAFLRAISSELNQFPDLPTSLVNMQASDIRDLRRTTAKNQTIWSEIDRLVNAMQLEAGWSNAVSELLVRVVESRTGGGDVEMAAEEAAARPAPRFAERLPVGMAAAAAAPISGLLNQAAFMVSPQFENYFSALSISPDNLRNLRTMVPYFIIYWLATRHPGRVAQISNVTIPPASAAAVESKIAYIKNALIGVTWSDAQKAALNAELTQDVDNVLAEIARDFEIAGVAPGVTPLRALGDEFTQYWNNLLAEAREQGTREALSFVDVSGV